MKNKKLIIVFFSFLLIFSLQSKVFATNYYVSTTGNNGNNVLSSSTTWRAIAKACSTVPANAGNVINIGDGTFLEASAICIPSGVTIIGAWQNLQTVK